MIKKILGVLIILFVVAGAFWYFSVYNEGANDGEQNEPGDEASATSTEMLTFEVAPEKQECTGVGPRECLVVNGELFYEEIEGFDFEPGFSYILEVERTERQNVPADRSSYNYRLIEEVEKEKEVDTDSPATSSKKRATSSSVDDGMSIAEKCQEEGGNWLEEYNECEFVEESWCEENNGQFAFCDSACRHDPDAEVCTQQCVQVCSFKE
jgi:hypothetical protein